MAYFGGIFFANMGGGGGQNYFQKQFLPVLVLTGAAPRRVSVSSGEKAVSQILPSLSFPQISH